MGAGEQTGASAGWRGEAAAADVGTGEWHARCGSMGRGVDGSVKVEGASAGGRREAAADDVGMGGLRARCRSMDGSVNESVDGSGMLGSMPHLPSSLPSYSSYPVMCSGRLDTPKLIGL